MDAAAGAGAGGEALDLAEWSVPTKSKKSKLKTEICARLVLFNLCLDILLRVVLLLFFPFLRNNTGRLLYLDEEDTDDDDEPLLVMNKCAMPPLSPPPPL